MVLKVLNPNPKNREVYKIRKENESSAKAISYILTKHRNGDFDV